MTQKEKILNNCRINGGTSIPIDNFVKYIRERVVSYQELVDAGLSEERAKSIQENMAEDDKRMWVETLHIDTLQAYREYLQTSPLLSHGDDAQLRINSFDNEKWNEASMTLTDASLNEYLNEFPQGRHADECRTLLADLPWLNAKRKNTIEAYSQYMANNPGKHVPEATAAIRAIQDDNAWNNACALNSSQAYRNYLAQYPNGKHASDAQSRINSGAAGEQFLNALQIDPNAFMAYEIQQKVGNGVVTWNDIQQIFGVNKTNAIMNFQLPAQLPNALAPESLQNNTTEVYFWGTPGSGKTCALGTIISSVTRSGIIEPLPCAGLHYMNQLSNIFVDDDYCTLPDSTNVGNIQEMIMNLRDGKKKLHKLTLIDLAGELFRSVYKKENNMPIDNENDEVLQKAMSYLRDRRNNKIHFFVVEYGAHNKKWDGLNMSNYLSYMIQFLKREKVFTKSTVGVYVLVTKCDKMNCPIEERPRYASEYVEQELASFWNTLKETCDNAAIKDVMKLAFSIGEVFAQQLCAFDGRDTNKVINKLLTKTPTIGGCFSWLMK